MDGLLAVWKEKDFTSHDVVAKLRGILHQKKIGHTGTLDPQAEGVLAIGLGIGTRACPLLPDHTKTYEAELLLGTTTDTEDIWGTPIVSREIHVDPEQLREAILSFQGTYLQTPPMYSAKKVGGQKLCDLARKGKVVEREPVSVTIYEIRVHEATDCRASFCVTCSAGTYIRTLCTDIGRKLGVEACMTSLTRTAACGFSKEQALTLTQIEQARDNGTLEGHLIPVDRALSMWPAVTVTADWTKRLLNGNAFLASAAGLHLQDLLPKEGEPLCRVYLEETGFIGVFRYEQESGLLRPFKMFLGAQ